MFNRSASKLAGLNASIAYIFLCHSPKRTG